MSRLADRVALITGASSGIGNEIAASFGREGADMVVADIRKEPKLENETAVCDRLDSIGAAYRFIDCDVSDWEDARHAVSTAVDAYGGLDILVNNAGIYSQGKVHETSNQEWDRIMAVNLRGPFLMSKAAVPQLKESEHAKILNVSSSFGTVGSEDSAAYCASKGGISNLTRQMGIDYAPEEINVNALAPGVVETAQNAEWRENDPGLVADWEDATPWPRFGKPEDVANAAVFLASDESDFVTGHVLAVDGGWTAR